MYYLHGHLKINYTCTIFVHVTTMQLTLRVLHCFGHYSYLWDENFCVGLPSAIRGGVCAHTRNRGGDNNTRVGLGVILVVLQG